MAAGVPRGAKSVPGDDLEARIALLGHRLDAWQEGAGRGRRHSDGAHVPRGQLRAQGGGRVDQQRQLAAEHVRHGDAEPL